MPHLRTLIATSLFASLLSSCAGHSATFAPPAPLSALPDEAQDESMAQNFAAGVKVAPDFRDLGPAPSSLQIRLSVVLRYQHQAELDALVQSQSDRTSASFRRYLTNAQFAQYFSPSIRAQRQVIDALTAAGLKVIQTYRNRTVIEVVGSSDAIERVFATKIHYGNQSGHGLRYMNVADAVMPAELRTLVFAVTGLDNLVEFAPQAQIVYPAMSGLNSSPPLRGPNGELGPLGFARAYDEPSQHGYDGTGRAIGTSYAGDIDNDDLHVFLNYFGIKPAHKLIRVTVDGGRLGTGNLETTLDVEAIMGTAPGAQVYLYSFHDFTEAGAVDLYNTVVDDDAVDVVNSSWGGCEHFKKRRLGHVYAEAANQIFEQGAAKGITFPIATGDFGWRTCSHHDAIDITTADDATHALAVGGTTLIVDSNGYWVKETAWHRSAGGVSLVFPRPAYQRDVVHIVGGGRNIPDVSLDANPHVGFAMRWHHIWVGAGGTSLGGPLWSGLEGQIDQYLGTRIGFVNPQLYALLKSPSYGTVFHDIVRGENGGYRALRGYDLVTGIGSPIGWPLAQALK